MFHGQNTPKSGFSSKTAGPPARVVFHAEQLVDHCLANLRPCSGYAKAILPSWAQMHNGVRVRVAAANVFLGVPTLRAELNSVLERVMQLNVQIVV